VEGAAVTVTIMTYLYYYGRLADMATSIYHSIQTHGVGSGHLVFVRQGMGGAISLMIVATREDTLLVRASG
jgi:hypothetical protein